MLVIKLFILIRHITVVTFQITAVTLDLESFFFFNFYDSTDVCYPTTFYISIFVQIEFFPAFRIFQLYDI